MRIFPVRKSRHSRVAAMKTESWTDRLGSQLAHGDVLLRLAICLLFSLILVLGMESWKVPFPHRLGDPVPDGILARIDFQRLNVQKTQQAQLERKSRVLPVFGFSESGLERLRHIPDDLRKQLFEIVTVDQFSQLSAETCSAFGWVSTGTGTTLDPPSQEFEADWQEVKSNIGSVKSAERKIDEIVGEFSQFTAPLRQTGVLDASEVTSRSLRLQSEIAVAEADSAEVRNYRVADVLLTEMLKASGNLGGQWKSFGALAPLQKS
ncbi:MAG: phosphohydrolase, partial [Planctomycetes bacterium]|nr:phosphohydrolase [Planctomycetota bacterium]